ncbi:hypothetical protein QR680_000332 [Steinernema hermaphroditum]|uniref:Uncharacterized protein n=1 Tax=Steinernema hermaphroditum TaxID=289476 RepID=A0AA39GU72_9BILA|nr:hypothetical protein QR680_000332 [Steinernema hermaphroditum]
MSTATHKHARRAHPLSTVHVLCVNGVIFGNWCGSEISIRNRVAEAHFGFTTTRKWLKSALLRYKNTVIMSSGLLVRLALLFGIAFSLAISTWSYVIKEQAPEDLTDMEKLQLLVDRRSPNVNNLVSQMLEKLNDGGSNALQVRRQMLSRKFWK